MNELLSSSTTTLSMSSSSSSFSSSTTILSQSQSQPSSSSILSSSTSSPSPSSSNCIRVVARFRPLTDLEQRRNESNIVNFQDSKSFVIRRSDGSVQQYSFDRTFNFDDTQESLFNDVATPIVGDFLDGYNGTILAYGQTASGKTYTIYGEPARDDEEESHSRHGIIPRIIEEIFNGITRMREKNNALAFVLKMSSVELYMEKINDLYDESKKNLQIREHPEKGIYLEGVTETVIQSPEDGFEFLNITNNNRAVAATNMSSASSRSHSILMIELSQQNLLDLSSKKSKLFLVDLAGSERASKTLAEGERMQEAKTINKSLSTLGTVINSLTSNKPHVPYRDSKLTRLLQDSLGGNSKTTLIIACSPSNNNESETLSTIQFGIRAKKITNKPKINKEITVVELKQLLEKANLRIKELELEIEFLLTKVDTQSKDLDTLLKEKDDITRAISMVTNQSDGSLTCNKKNKLTESSETTLIRTSRDKSFSSQIATTRLQIEDLSPSSGSNSGSNDGDDIDVDSDIDLEDENKNESSANNNHNNNNDEDFVVVKSDESYKINNTNHNMTSFMDRFMELKNDTNLSPSMFSPTYSNNNDDYNNNASSPHLSPRMLISSSQSIDLGQSGGNLILPTLSRDSSFILEERSKIAFTPLDNSAEATPLLNSPFSLIQDRNTVNQQSIDIIKQLHHHHIHGIEEDRKVEDEIDEEILSTSTTSTTTFNSGVNFEVPKLQEGGNEVKDEAKEEDKITHSKTSTTTTIIDNNTSSSSSSSSPSENTANKKNVGKIIVFTTIITLIIMILGSSFITPSHISDINVVNNHLSKLGIVYNTPPFSERPPTLFELRKAYQQSLLKFHPDKNLNCKECPSISIDIQNSYHLLRLHYQNPTLLQKIMDYLPFTITLKSKKVDSFMMEDLVETDSQQQSQSQSSKSHHQTITTEQMVAIKSQQSQLQRDQADFEQKKSLFYTLQEQVEKDQKSVKTQLLELSINKAEFETKQKELELERIEFQKKVDQFNQEQSQYYTTKQKQQIQQEKEQKEKESIQKKSSTTSTTTTTTTTSSTSNNQLISTNDESFFAIRWIKGFVNILKQMFNRS